MTTQTIKTAISLDRHLFSRSDVLARELQMTRSGLIAQALEEFIAKRRNRNLLAKLNQVYAAQPELPRTVAARARHKRIIADAW